MFNIRHSFKSLILMSVADRRAREREELRRKILDTARDLFVAHGYAGVTLRKIAAAIDYSPGAIYSYFRDKDELLRALCVADFEAFELSVPRHFDSPDPVDGLRAIGRAYIGFALKHPNHYRLMFMTPKPAALKQLDDDVLAKKGDPARDGYALLRQVVAQAIAQGRLQPRWRDAELVAQTLWAGVHGMAALEIAMASDPWLQWSPRAERVEAILDALIDGLAATRA